MKSKLLGAIAISAALLFTGCATNEAPAPAAKKVLTAPSAKVAKLIKKFDLKIVDYDYAKAKVAKGTRKGAKALFIDARPPKMYAKSTIPSSLNIPDTKFDKFVGQLDKVAKDKEIIVYCGGWKCGKSPKVAGMLKAKGFTDVKLYQAGEPEWKKKNYVEVATAYVSGAVKKGKAVIIDARPAKMFAKSTIPGAIAIPDTKIAKFYPQVKDMDKKTEMITFCGGYHCGKSHKVAKFLMKEGFKNVKVYAGGLPAWKKAGKPLAGKAAKKAVKKMAKKASTTAGIKKGEDEGTVDGEWFKANYKNIPNLQIVDVRSADEHAAGAMAGAINIEAESMDAKAFVAKLPKDKIVVFHCASGGRAMEAADKAKEGGADMSKTFYFDANLDCEGSKCNIEVNEPLG